MTREDEKAAERKLYWLLGIGGGLLLAVIVFVAWFA